MSRTDLLKANADNKLDIFAGGCGTVGNTPGNATPPGAQPRLYLQQ